MRNGIVTMVLFALFMAVPQFGVVNRASAGPVPASAENIQLRISFGGGEALVSLYDSQAGRELVAMLPLTLSFEDYAQTEKIAYLPGKLSSPAPASAGPGDFTYYSPWGNLAVFYKGYGQASGLYILGKIESGKEALAKLGRSFTATIELVDR